MISFFKKNMFAKRHYQATLLYYTAFKEEVNSKTHLVFKIKFIHPKHCKNNI